MSLKKILIGSRAIKNWYPHYKREPKDIDYAVEDRDIFDKEHGVEFLENRPLLKYCEKTPFGPSQMMALKMSHIFWPVNTDKHLYDIRFLRDQDVDPDLKLFKILYDYWPEVHGPDKRSDLNMSAKDFFTNGLKCPHDHDYLHTLIKNPPTFTKILKDGEEVLVSENKFNKLSFEEKCDLVREEVYIMAYERYSSMHWKAAYRKMLKKFVRDHAPIWEAIFILNNFSYLYDTKFNYKKHINYELRTIERHS